MCLLCEILLFYLEQGREISFPIKVIWNSRVPLGILTLDQLKRRGWAMSKRCSLCFKEKESADHILLHCEKTRVLWHRLFSLFGVVWVVLPHSIEVLIHSWQGSFVGKRGESCGRLFLYACFRQYGKQEMRWFFKIKGYLFKDLNSNFYAIFGSGQMYSLFQKIRL